MSLSAFLSWVFQFLDTFSALMCIGKQCLKNSRKPRRSTRMEIFGHNACQKMDDMQNVSVNIDVNPKRSNKNPSL